jgi:thiol:disulfide interchange protein DsbC
MSFSKPKVCLPVAALIAALIAGPAAFAGDDEAELAKVRETVTGMFNQIAPDDVTPSPIDGWYTIHKGSIVAYISADGRYLMQGDLIDLDKDANLSDEVRNKSRRELISSVPDSETIVFSPDHPKYRVTVFTDVECPYCRRLHSQIKDYMAKGIEIRYLLYPREGPDSRSWKTAEKVWCSPDRANALTMAKLDRKFDTADCDASEIAHQYAMGKDVGLEGTPAIVLDDGTLLGGYVPPAMLKAQLDKHAAKAD